VFRAITWFLILSDSIARPHILALPHCPRGHVCDRPACISLATSAPEVMYATARSCMRWRASARTWLSRGVTSRGGWHLRHIRARTWQSGPCSRHGRGLVGHVSSKWGTHARCDTHNDLVVEPQNHPALRIGGFCRVWASKLGSRSSRGNRWWHVAS
jgi:hypothetical protein